MEGKKDVQDRMASGDNVQDLVDPQGGMASMTLREAMGTLRRNVKQWDSYPV